MKINIILPFFSEKPGGGIKIMYEYANRLSYSGFDVTIYHCTKLSFTINDDVSNSRILFKHFITSLFNKNHKRPKWFSLNDNIQCQNIPFIDNTYIRDADFIISTWWATVIECRQLQTTKGKMLNFIQGYENWTGHDDLLHMSYTIPNQINIAISQYIQNQVAKVSNNRLELISNCIDSKEFFITTKIEDRAPASISLMFSKQTLKGSKYALEAIDLLKSKFPDLIVQVFSVYSRPKKLPKWISFYKNPPELCSIYNNTAIFLSSSLEEGWGLPPMESMASGCACVATNIPGHKEFLTNEENSLLIEPQSVESIVNQISFLIENNQYRINLAQRGYSSITTKYTWNNSVSKLIDLLRE